MNVLLNASVQLGGGPTGYPTRHDLRPPQPARRDLPPRGGRSVPYARGVRAGLRRRAAALRRAPRARRRPFTPRPALPPAPRGGPAPAGPAQVGRRRALRPALPRPRDGPAVAGHRVRAPGARGARLLPGAAPRSAAV